MEVAYSVSISITMMPSSDLSVFENVQAIALQTYIIHIKVIKQHGIALTVHNESIHP